jgi:SAM-dependent methyltransferase
LGRRFEAAVCSFNSLNYVGDLGELGAVFRSVADHLRPGGLFVFDTHTCAAMDRVSGMYLHAEAEGKRFAIHFDYDWRRLREKAVVLLRSGVEIHWRIPIDPTDVEAASEGSGLVVEDYFSSAFVPGRWYTGPTCFFVLSRGPR